MGSREAIQREKAKEAYDALSTWANSMMTDPEYLVEQFLDEHRTLQQKLLRAMAYMIWEAARLYDEGYYDARNESSFKWAKKVRDCTGPDLPVFPFI